MELSKKVAYLKGLMAGLKISDATPEGQVLLCMSDILEQMADEIEDASHAVNAVTDYLDELSEGGDPLDDIDTYEYGFDPEGEYEEWDDDDDGDGEDVLKFGRDYPLDEEDGGDAVSFPGDLSEDGEEPENESGDEEETEAEEQSEAEEPVREEKPEEPEEPAHTEEEKPAKDGSQTEEKSIGDRFSELLNNITSDPDYTDDVPESGSKLVDTLMDMVSKELSDCVDDDEQSEPDHEQSLIDRLAAMMKAHEQYTGSDENEDEEEETSDGEDGMIFGMNCPFCHSDITFSDKDIVNSEFECPVCGNRLTIMM